MMRQVLSLAGLAVGLVTLLTGPAAAQPPVVEAGECLYLVGAPAGAPAAETEERTESSRIYEACTMEAHVDLNRDGENMIQAWMAPDPAAPPVRQNCESTGAVGHLFRISPAAGGPIQATVGVRGRYAFRLEGSGSGDGDRFGAGARVQVEAGELSSEGELVIIERPVADFSAHSDERRDIDDTFGVAIDLLVRPGRTYFLRLALALDATNRVLTADAGSPGSGLGVEYQSIEICVAAASIGTAAGTEALEHALYLRDCYPGIWLPVASGGQLETARDLVATRLLQAEGTGAPGVNIPVARRDLAQADAAIGDGDYQRACRSLVKSLHALTTP